MATTIDYQNLFLSVTNQVLQENSEIVEDNSISDKAKHLFLTLDWYHRFGDRFEVSRDYESLVRELKDSKYKDMMIERFGNEIFNV